LNNNRKYLLKLIKNSLEKDKNLDEVFIDSFQEIVRGVIDKEEFIIDVEFY